MLTYHFLVFDEPGQLPELFVVLQHSFEIFLSRRFPVFEDRKIAIEFITIGCLTLELLNKMRDSLASNRCHALVEEELLTNWIG